MVYGMVIKLRTGLVAQTHIHARPLRDTAFQINEDEPA
jgi:hypothetical protein